MKKSILIRALSSSLIASVAVVAACSLVIAAPVDNAPVAMRAVDFLSSIGVNSAIDKRGETLEDTIRCAKYTGIRWFRAGIEGDTSIDSFVRLHDETDVRFSWGIGSGGSDIDKLITTARKLEKAAPGALLAFEGPNEPNNWGIVYRGEKGGSSSSWLPLAKMQAELYMAVKSDPALAKYPVWSIAENGAEAENVGLQFLTIPVGVGALMPSGTKYADCANVHNYIYHPNSPGIDENKTWNASDPTSACKVDGLYGNYGVTWAHRFPGYSEAQLQALPRVTTETGALIGDNITEEIQGLNILSMYLDQFKRGCHYTALYLLRDRVDEAGNQRFGLYRPDYSPRKAAVYLHNLTAILSDNGFLPKNERLNYTIPNEPSTVHDLLLQKSVGVFELVVWDERTNGRTDQVVIDLGPARRSVSIYDPTVGAAPEIHMQDIKSLILTLSDHPKIIEVARKGAAR